MKKITKTSKKETLADKIANILATAPASLDPEDQVDETSAKLNERLEENYESEEELLSKFRKQNLDLLADVDIRYAGKGGSRKDLLSSGELSGDDTSENEDESDNNEDIEDHSENGNSSDTNTEIEETEDEYASDQVSDAREDNGLEISEDNTPDAFKHIKETNVSAHIKRGMCVRNQLCLWENLLEMRIQIHKCLVAANKMPQCEKYQEIKDNSGTQFTKKVTETKNIVSNLLEKLLLLQKLALKRYPETKNLENTKDKKQTSDSDQDISSDTENESLCESVDEEFEESPRKMRKLEEFEKDINTQHDKYKSYRNSVIQKWHDKTRIIVTKNNSNPQSIIGHIEQILSDKSKLIRRTQLKKSDFKIIGQQNDTGEVIKNDSQEFKTAEEYNTNIFDDDDFYHQLLRELIEVKSADLTDPIQLGRQWVQLQSLRSKMKRKVDTKATKGRKIRYAVHTKLVNYMAPIEENLWTDEAKSELYSSLFGKNKLSTI